ncbi:hypothetical protein ACOSQ4_016457 [Xanthoceras sorbifolium]
MCLSYIRIVQMVYRAVFVQFPVFYWVLGCVFVWFLDPRTRSEGVQSLDSSLSLSLSLSHSLLVVKFLALVSVYTRFLCFVGFLMSSPLHTDSSDMNFLFILCTFCR